MRYQESLDLIIKTIAKEKAKDPENPLIKLDLSLKENYLLCLIDIDSMRSILDKLQDEDKILKIDELEYRRAFVNDNTILGSATSSRNRPHYFQYHPCFTLEILENFESWHNHYIMTKEQQIKDLTCLNKAKIYDLASKINEKSQLSNSWEIEIDFEYKPDLLELKGLTLSELKQYRLEALRYLEQNSIIINYYVCPQIPFGEAKAKTGFSLSVDVSKLKEFLPKIRNAYETKKNPEIAVTESVKTDKSTLKLPPDTKWEDITIQFKDGHNVDIKFKDKTTRSDYKAMGFEDKRTKHRNPNMQWELLIKLSKNNGEISWQSSPQHKLTKTKSTEQDFSFEGDEDDAYNEKNKGFSYIKAANEDKKRKQGLVKTLKEYFGINEDPFRPYRKEGSYKIRIKLIPD